MIKAAKANNKDTRACFLACSADKTPFHDETYDFVYLINVLHHLADIEYQKNTLQEMRRILKRGGLLFISEVNEDLLLFKWYMKYIFPLTNKIHGHQRKEEYRTVKEALALTKDDWHMRDIGYFTYMPNITPACVFPLLRKIEHYLEERTKYKFGAHWVMTLQKEH